jgi:hypothetical protein
MAKAKVGKRHLPFGESRETDSHYFLERSLEIFLYERVIRNAQTNDGTLRPLFEFQTYTGGCG